MYLGSIKSNCSPVSRVKLIDEAANHLGIEKANLQTDFPYPSWII